MCRTRATSLLPSAQKLARRRTSDRAETCLVALASPWSVDSADPVPPPVREFGWPRAAAAPCCLFESVQPVRRFGKRVAVGPSEMVGTAGGEQRGFGEVVVRDDPHGVGAQLHGGCYRYPDVVRIEAQVAAAGAEQFGRLAKVSVSARICSSVCAGVGQGARCTASCCDVEGPVSRFISSCAGTVVGGRPDTDRPRCQRPRAGPSSREVA